ncbi:TetR/AcrR family transcriptional regulator [Cohnella zeiphila]|uniref:TetR/AcrR family transcriptional regulator n=1 Tax=Cohnella zeiphila TaxID=2761120 RepID=A0A7X0SJD3_9BACL|nr:TetR/AcrR family transcriptional regulator [Cohnella zeiphila]MBB6731041.1 TetR/AcrR family transcriptional regulator [Cohnella zeiphila]
MYTNKPHRDKTDLRVRRTRKLLWEALLALLQSRSFESLTIQEICDQAMVHRTTFYKHFEDKFSLLSYGLTEIREMLAARSYEDRILHPMLTFERLGQPLPLEAVLRSQPENGFLINMMQKHACDSLMKDLEEAERNGARFRIPLEALASFYSGAVSSLATWWVLSGKEIPAQEVDRYLQSMINRRAFFPGSEANAATGESQGSGSE